MDIKEILAKVDHTVLGQTATWADIKGLCDDGMKYETASVCIPPSYVKQAAEYIKSVNGKLKVCTVIGFPNGYNTTAVKCFETKTAVEEGASSLLSSYLVAMVISVSGQSAFLCRDCR